MHHPSHLGEEALGGLPSSRSPQEGFGAAGSEPHREEETRRRGPDSTKRADGSMEESGGDRWRREGMRWGRGTEVAELMRMGYVDGLTVGGATFG